jgi:hypothetical protein
MRSVLTSISPGIFALLAFEKLRFWLVTCTHLLRPPVCAGMLALRANLVSERERRVCLIHDSHILLVFDDLFDHTRTLRRILRAVSARAKKVTFSFLIFKGHERSAFGTKHHDYSHMESYKNLTAPATRSLAAMIRTKS